MTTINELLRRTADFFEKHPQAWCQGTSYRNANGESCDFSEATSFCLVGRLALEDDWRYGVGNLQWTAALDELRVRLGGEEADVWNDRPWRTVQDVITLLRGETP